MPIFTVNEVPAIPLSCRTPEQRTNDLENVLTVNWIRSGKPTELDTPTGVFSKIDQMLPHKQNQSPENRGKDIEGALDFYRNTTIVFHLCKMTALTFLRLNQSQCPVRILNKRLMFLVMS